MKPVVEEPVNRGFWSQIDLADVLLVLGIGLFLGGIGAFSLRIALIMAGLLCFSFVFLIERGQSRSSVKDADESPRK